MGTSKRDMLLEIGERLFAQHGYKEVNIEAICESVGMATGSFYNYFPSKDAFYEQILTKLETRGIEQADRLVSGLQSPLNQLKALYRFATLGIQKNTILRGIFTGDRRFMFPGWKEHAGRANQLHKHIEGLVTRILRNGTAERVFRSGRYQNPTALIIALYDAILLNLGNPSTDVLQEDLLIMMERGLKRTLRLRSWEDRKDRVAQRRAARRGG